MISLVGYTGFVGSNIYDQGKAEIEGLYNSSNIESSFNTKPDLLIYSGLRAEKFLANSNPEEDYKNILIAEDNIQRINPKKLVLISTIDVFKEPNGKDENSNIDTDNLHPYGLNRYRLETWVRENYPDALIIRLPGLFGKNIKKNFIYDMINKVPSMIKDIKMDELVATTPDIKSFYTLSSNNFYKINNLTSEDKKLLLSYLEDLDFTALKFTDSRSRFQFYNLKNLWKDINIALDNNLTIFHPATEPVSSSEVYEYVYGKEFENILNNAVDYDYKTIYADLWGQKNGYICSKNEILKEIKDFCETFSI